MNWNEMNENGNLFWVCVCLKRTIRILSVTRRLNYCHILETRIFLQDLEGCLETPESVGACFLKRVRCFFFKCWHCGVFFSKFLSVSCHLFTVFFPLCLLRKRASKCTSATVRISRALRRCGDSSPTVPSFRSAFRHFPHSNKVFVWLIYGFFPR